MKCPYCRQEISMIASICPFCRSSFRAAEREVPQVIMDAIDGGKGYDRSKEPVRPFEPYVETFDLAEYLWRLVRYTAIMWFCLFLLAHMLLPPGLARDVSGWGFWVSLLVTFMWGKRLEKFFEL